ncbi:MAG: ABC transporter permease [Treponema sp.]|jgi:hypothetical protein|nr:ABC transporter permease [Treponema sp.]
MEKQGMDSRRSRRRTGLLNLFSALFFLLIFINLTLSAQEEVSDTSDTPAAVLPAAPLEDVETTEAVDDKTDTDWLEITLSSPALIRTIPWTITFLVDYPYPSGIFITPPDFPEELMLEEVRIEPRLVTNAAGKRRSSIRFTFIPQKAAHLLLGSFEVRTPNRSTVTEAIPLTITSSGAGTHRPYVRWERGKTDFKIGTGGDLFLKLLDWDAGKKRPPNFFLFEIPEHAIVEERPLTPVEAARNIVLHLTLIPLEGSEITINHYSFQHEGYTLEIPPLRLKVLPKDDGSGGGYMAQRGEPPVRGENAAPMDDNAPVADSPATFITPIPKFSADMRTLLHILSKRVHLFGTDTLIQDVRTLWQERRIAESLALIRKAERDHTFGPIFASGRREMERYIALEPIHDETWVPKKLCFILFLCILTSLLFFLIIGLINKTGEKIPIIVMAFLLPALFFAYTGILQPKEAVLRGSDAFYVPETNGEIQNHFNEGQCVFVRSISGDWALVETLDSRTGWVMVEDTVFY